MDRPGDRPSLRGLGPAVLLVGASLAFATSGPLARYARPAHPLIVAAGRVALAALLLAASDPRGLRRSLVGLTWGQRLGLLAVGATLGAHFALFIWGLDRTSLPAAVALISLEPLSVVLCAWMLFGLRPSPLERLGVLVATVGALVVAWGSGQGEHRLLGDLLVLGAVVLYGLYIAGARGYARVLPARHYAATIYAAAALVLALAMPIVVGLGDPTLLAPLSRRSWIGIVLLALVPTLLGHTAVQGAARRLSPSVVALVSAGETVGGLAISALLLRLPPTPLDLAGAAVIAVGVAAAVVGARAARP